MTCEKYIWFVTLSFQMLSFFSCMDTKLLKHEWGQHPRTYTECRITTININITVVSLDLKVNLEIKHDGTMGIYLSGCLLTVCFHVDRGRGWRWLWNWPPGLLWSLPAGWWDNLVWHLPQSIPYGLSWPWHGKGPWGHLELPTLCKDNIPNLSQLFIYIGIQWDLYLWI